MRSLSFAFAAVFFLLAVSPSADAFFGKKEKKGGGETCQTVYDEVWEEKCHTLYDETCRTEYVEECSQIDERVCATRDEKECSLVFKEKCKEIHIPKCSVKLETKCRTEPECTTVRDEVCKTVPKQICTTVNDKQCQTIEERQCRDVVVSEQVGNFIKVDEQVVSTSRHVAADTHLEHEQDYVRVDDSELDGYVNTGEVEDQYRVLDQTDVPVYHPTPIREGDTIFRGIDDGKNKGKKHGIFRRSVRDRLKAKKDKLHARLDSLKDKLLNKGKKGKKEDDEAIIYEQVPLARAVVKASTRQDCRLVPTKRCRDVPREQCRSETERVCTQVPKEICQNVEKCRDFPRQECVTETRQACLKVPERECVLVPKQHCDVVPRRACAQVPRQECTQVPSKSCKKITVSRPREVCEHPVSSNRDGGKKGKKGGHGDDTDFSFGF